MCLKFFDFFIFSSSPDFYFERFSRNNRRLRRRSDKSDKSTKFEEFWNHLLVPNASIRTSFTKKTMSNFNFLRYFTTWNEVCLWVLTMGLFIFGIIGSDHLTRMRPLTRECLKIEHSTEEQRLVTKGFGRTQAFNQLKSKLKRGQFKVVANLRIWNLCNFGKVKCADKCAFIYFIFILYLIACMKGSMSSSWTLGTKYSATIVNLNTELSNWLNYSCEISMGSVFRRRSRKKIKTKYCAIKWVTKEPTETPKKLLITHLRKKLVKKAQRVAKNSSDT